MIIRATGVSKGLLRAGNYPINIRFSLKSILFCEICANLRDLRGLPLQNEREGFYSVFKLFTGFVAAAFNDWNNTVTAAIITAVEPATINTNGVI